MPYCQSCGREIQTAAKYCGECGEAVNADPTDASADGGAALSREQRTAQPAQPVQSKAVAVGNTDVVGRRIVAVIIDTIIVSIGVAVVSLLFRGLLPGIPGGPELFLILGAPLWFLYFWLLEAAWGQTVGKMLLGIEVRGEDGRKPDYSTSFVRNLLRFIDAFFYYFIGFVLIVAKDKNQRLGDMAANTVVVRTGS